MSFRLDFVEVEILWPWWVSLIALGVGAVIGMFLAALMIANGRSDPRE